MFDFDRPKQLQDGWTVGAPEQQGLDASLLRAMGERAGSTDVHGIVVVRHGILVYERYFTAHDGDDRVTFDATTKHRGNSMAKSVTSLLVGIAADRGAIKDLDASVFSFFPEYADLRSPEKDRITIRHLLTMSDGLEWFDFLPPYDTYGKFVQAPDPYRYIIERPVMMEPGRSFNYNSGSTELLGAILQKTTGKAIDVFAKEELFDPLDIDDVEWEALPSGNPAANNGLWLRPRDWAKLGQLVLSRGVWNGVQLISPSWIAKSITPQNNGPGVFLYGYQWWIGRSYGKGRVTEWAGAMGWGGQRLIVVPAFDLVLLVTADLSTFMGLPESILLNQYLLPAVLQA